MLFEGERIKIFPETNINAYTRWILSQGFTYTLEEDAIVITKKIYKKYDPNKLANLIREKRILWNMTRKDLADKVGVLEGTVFNWEVGRYIPYEYNLNIMKDVLNISERELERCQI